jgi:hypothetical protein
VANINSDININTKQGVNGSKITVEGENWKKNDNPWLPCRTAKMESESSNTNNPTTPNPDNKRCKGGFCKTVLRKQGKSRQSSGSFADFNGGWPVHSPKLRSVDDGIQHGASKIRAYGNAIVPQVAAEFIKAVMQIKP